MVQPESDTKHQKQKGTRDSVWWIMRNCPGSVGDRSYLKASPEEESLQPSQPVDNGWECEMSHLLFVHTVSALLEVA